MITDLLSGPDGILYAVQMGQFTEQGPTPNSGAVIRVKQGDTSEVVVSGLPIPTSINFNPAGDAYVTTNGASAPGSGEVLTFAALTKQAGSPVPPLSLSATGGERAYCGWIAAGGLALGLSLVAAGFLLRQRRLR